VLIGLLLVGAAFTLARETGACWWARASARGHRKRARGVREGPGHRQRRQPAKHAAGPDEVLLTAAVQFRRGMRIDEVEDAIERLEKAVAALYPSIRHIYFESGALRSAMA
jgi:hypothetical protein